VPPADAGLSTLSGDSGDSNPLMRALGLPAFDRIEVRHVVPALDALLDAADRALAQAAGATVAADYETLALLLDVPVERLGRAWSAVTHLCEVADAPELRKAFHDALPRITDFYTRLGADPALYGKYRQIAASGSALKPAQRQALQHTLREFVLGGAELQGAARERFAQLQERAAELQQCYGEHVLDATDRFTYVASEAEMEGVPQDVRLATRIAPTPGAQAPRYRLTLHDPCYLPVMEHAQDRALRQRLYRAHVTRASELGDSDLDNTALMRELLALRQEQARLLGYPSYAELSLVPKMADSAAQVHDFLADLAQRARPFAERDLAELREFAARELALPDLQPWDMAFAAERLKQSRYAFSSTELRQYFTEPRVLQGLFGIAETLFEIEIRPDSAPAWHDSVRYFSIYRGGAPIGRFYLDLHARPGKHSGAWMDNAQQRWHRPDGQGMQLPVALLVCNFAPPVLQDGQVRPALLSHDDLITLFHEFGHGLHHLLTQVDELSVSGLSGVEWDAVELPSQFMENFCWEWPVLQRLSAHLDTGEPLPRDMFDKLLAARNFNSGLRMLRHMEFALFDLRIHREHDAEAHLLQVAHEVRAQVGLAPSADFNRFAHSFSHIFDGGYAAGYYSYSWAEVLSADVWSAFEETGVFDPEMGRRYRQTILEVGGSRAAIDSFKAFRGREPRIDALLRHQGMA
jgi:oligopeptidase A